MTEIQHFIISRGPDWDHVYMSANEPQTLRYQDEYSQATKVLDAEYKPASLDDVIKTCENLHVEEKHQPKTLLQKYEHLLMEHKDNLTWNQLVSNWWILIVKPNHACAYTVPRSVEQQLQQSKEIVRLVDIGVLEEEADYSSEWASRIPTFEIPKKNGIISLLPILWRTKLNLLLKQIMSPIFHSKDWQCDMIRSMEGFTFASAFELNKGILSHQTWWLILMENGKIKMQMLIHGYQDCQDPDVFENFMSKIFQDMEYV
jgi:hypothetical protein